ncbi:hypothetical protein KUCAC02_036619 [Chaenocephalus aceratus]|nr:hypothetical protein KUCAC02_036619 [Chaenocephalus aceratus]
MGDSGGLHLCTWRKESARRIYLGLVVLLHLVVLSEASSVSKSCEKKAVFQGTAKRSRTTDAPRQGHLLSLRLFVAAV